MRQTMNWSAPLVVAITGGLFGAFLAFLAGLALQERNRTQGVKSLRLALASEVMDLHETLREGRGKRYEELGFSQRAVNRHLEEKDARKALLERFPHGLRHPVYLANLNRIGDLPPNLALRVVRFYSAIMDYEADVRRVLQGELDTRFFQEPNPKSVFRDQLRMAVRAEFMARRLRGERGRWRLGR